MNTIGIIQRRLAENKETIWWLEKDIEATRQAKIISDASNDIEDEYFAHNYLKIVRKRLKQLVAEQKFLKQIKRYL